METVDIRRQNLQALVDQSSLSEVARKVGKTPSQLGDILKKRRTFGERMARSMEKYAGWKEGTLDQSSKNDQEETAALENLGFKRIPIYSDIRAGLFNGGQLADRDTCINNGDFVLCDDSYRDSDFALRIAGDSMEPVFKEGDLIILDPDIPPHPGDFVVARRIDTATDDAEFTFKQYKEVGLDSLGRVIFQLCPLNPTYRPYLSDREDCKVIAVMIEHRIFRQK